MKLFRNRTWICISVFLAVLLAAGCGAGSTKSSATMAMNAATAMAETYAETTAAAAPVEMPEEAYDYEMEGGVTDAMPAPAAGLTADAGGPDTAAPVQTGRKLIRTVSMDVETKDFDGLFSAISAKITELGGYMESSDVSGRRLDWNGDPIARRAFITARIPSAKLDSFVTYVEDDGNVTNKMENVEDVTLRYTDVESKKKTLELEQERIWDLLEKAESIDSVIALEERLSEIRYELEKMESQLRVYDNQVDYSTVNLSVYEVINSSLTPTEPLSATDRIRMGFADNLVRLGTASTNFFIGVLTFSPFWVPVVVIVLIVWRVVTAKMRKKKKSSEPEQPGGGAADK